MKTNKLNCKLGSFDLSNYDEYGSINASAKNIFLHPDWDKDQEKYEGDIAIVELENSIEYSDSIQPICLPRFSHDEVTGIGTIVGWGFSEKSPDKFEYTPQKLLVPAVNISFCLETFPRHIVQKSVRNFCGGYVNQSKGICNGDSGGGFYAKESTSFFWKIQGVISIGAYKSSLCDVNQFGLYTNVAKFIGWINEIIGKSQRSIEKKLINQTIPFICDISNDNDINRR